VFSFRYSQQPGYTQADQEETFRRLNALVKTTHPNSVQPDDPIVMFIDGTYGGKSDVPGTRANSSWVPPGWSATPNLYNNFVKLFCRECHVAMSGPLTFTSSAIFTRPTFDPITQRPLGGLRDQIQSAICAGAMPHAEVPFRKFWQNPNLNWIGYLQDPSVLGIRCN